MAGQFRGQAVNALEETSGKGLDSTELAAVLPLNVCT